MLTLGVFLFEHSLAFPDWEVCSLPLRLWWYRRGQWGKLDCLLSILILFPRIFYFWWNNTFYLTSQEVLCFAGLALCAGSWVPLLWYWILHQADIPKSQSIFLRVCNCILRCPELGEIFNIVCELFFCTVKTFPEGIVLKKCVMAKENPQVWVIQVVGAKHQSTSV